jgi:hypothetical protein
MMNYNELNALFNERQKIERDWIENLHREAHLLGQEFAESIGAPDYWINPSSGTREPYVSIVGLKGARAGDPKPFRREDIEIHDGLMPFCLKLTFENGPNLLPKRTSTFAFGVRQYGQEFHFCRLDAASLLPSSEWLSGRKSFIDFFTEELQRELESTPIR